MFPRVNGLIKRGHALAAKSDATLDLAQALVRDIQDGFGVKVRLTKGFSEFANKLVVCVVKYLVSSLSISLRNYIPYLPKSEDVAHLDLSWLEGEVLPVQIEMDPTVDILPSRISTFVGGSHDYKQYVVDQHKTELLLEGGERYVWDGSVFQYQGKTE